MSLLEKLATQPMRRFQTRVIVICIILAFVDGFEVLVAAFTASAVGKAFVLDPVQIGYFLSAGTFGMGVGAIVISPLADRLGRRNHIILCLSLIAVGMGASALATSFSMLLVARAFAGLWIGALIPSLNILVAEYSSDAKRGTAMGIYGIGLPAGAASGGFITTFLIQAWDWRAPFWFGFSLTVALLLGCLVWLPESIHYLVDRRPAGALEKYNKIAVKLGYEPDDQLPPARPIEHAKGLIGAIFHGVMAKRTALLWTGYAALSAAFYFANTWTPRLLTGHLTTKVPKSQVAATGWDSFVETPVSAIEALAKSEPTKGWDPTVTYVQQMSDTAAQAFGNNAGVLVATGGVVGALLFASLARRIHPRILTALTLFWGLIAYVLYANFFKAPALALLLAVGVGIAANGGIAAFYAISPPIYPTMARGTGVGWMIGFGRIVAILAPIVAGYLIAAGMSTQTLYQAFGVVLALSGLCVIALHRTFVSTAAERVKETSLLH
jgi:MFS family permease